MKTSVSKEFSFCYGHYLPGHPGKCKQQHGHNSRLIVTLDGVPKGSGAYTGLPSMICDFSYLKEVVNREIIEVLDHILINNLPKQNCENSMFDVMIEEPTAENMAGWIFTELTFFLGSCVSKVTLYETPTSFVEVTR